MVSDRISSRTSFKSYGLIALTALSVLFAGTASADPACDTKFMDAMKQKAWMEAQREIMIAESIIAKPDSVFALGCFDNFHSAYAGSIQFYNDKTYASGGSGGNSSISTYLSAAFAHNLGGGHYSVGIGNDRSNPCSAMTTLWNAARCYNAGDNDPANIFTLNQISTYDRGSFPQACSTPGAWTTPLDTFAKKVAKQSVLAQFDDMNLFLDVTAPLSQTKSGNCSAGLPTGVTFATSNGSRDEVVCPNPGCTPNTSSPPKCCKMTVTSGSAPSESNCSS